MEASPDKKPAVAMCCIRIYTHALVVGLNDCEAFTVSKVFVDMLEHPCGVVGGIIKQHIQPCLCAFAWFMQIRYQRFEFSSAAACTNKLYQKLNHYVSAIVKEIVLLQCAVTAGFHCEDCRLAQAHLALCLVDNVAISAFESMMTAAEGCNEIRQPG